MRRQVHRHGLVLALWFLVVLLLVTLYRSEVAALLEYKLDAILFIERQRRWLRHYDGTFPLLPLDV